MTPTRHLGGPDVPRETLDALNTYAQLLTKWNARINLVSPGTIDDLWQRHFADSAQLWPLIDPQVRTATDFGSGAGFPALVLALIARDRQHPLTYHLVESDGRKAAFLSTVAREIGLRVTVHNLRLESAELPEADLITARAFAPLADLIGHAAQVRHPSGQALFLKGRGLNKELDEARRLWNFDYRLHPSLTDPEAAVVEIGAIHGRC